MPDINAFRKVARQEPAYRPAAVRVKDYQPIDDGLQPRDFMERQASRCMSCGVPFCQSSFGCPVSNIIPDWNQLLARGDYKGALTSLHQTNNFPEFTGLLCPAPCESACVLNINKEPVTIRRIELTIIEQGFVQGWVRPEPPSKELEGRVAIVGSGPAGLAAAQQLRRKGYQVTVFEAAPRLGGLLRYGIPDFKLDKTVLDRRLAQLSAEGVVFRAGVRIGRDIKLDQLRRDFDLVGLAVGAEKARDLDLPGRDLEGVVQGMDYLTEQNRATALETKSPAYSAAGKDVVILGGGDTGSDCLGTALRQGARSVHQFELLPRPPESRPLNRPWPLLAMTLKNSHAHDEGGQRQWSIATEEFVGAEGKLKALKTVRIEHGRDGYQAISGSEALIPCDLAILAVGFTGIDTQRVPFAMELHSAPRHSERITTDKDYRTTLPGVYAAGDARRGASLIVWAIAEGRAMASAMHRHLLG